MPAAATAASAAARHRRLPWAPPAGWQSFTVVNVATTGGTHNLTAGQDYRLVMPASPVNKRIRVNNGRHVVVVGGEINIDTQHAAEDDRNAIWFDGVTGTIHVEGLWLHGDWINDGIKGNSGAAIWQIQNCRIEHLVAEPNTYHSDVIQPYGGFQALRIDKVTGESEYQGQMFKADFNRWLTTDIRRYNLRHVHGLNRDGKLCNFVNGPGPNPQGNPWIEGPIHLGQQFYIYSRGFTDPIDNTQPPGDANAEVIPNGWFTKIGSASAGTQYMEPLPSGWATDNPGLVMDGIIRNTNPPGGDYVPAPGSGGNVGLNYVSPGYL